MEIGTSFCITFGCGFGCKEVHEETPPHITVSQMQAARLTRSIPPLLLAQLPDPRVLRHGSVPPVQSGGRRSMIMGPTHGEGTISELFQRFSRRVSQYRSHLDAISVSV